MDWLFSDESAATLFVLAGTCLFALIRHLVDGLHVMVQARRADDSAVVRLEAH
jgi:hypothetical protein